MRIALIKINVTENEVIRIVSYFFLNYANIDNFYKCIVY